MRSYKKLDLDEIWVVKEVESCYNVKFGASWEASHGRVGEFWVSKLDMLCRDVKSSSSWEETHVLYFIFYRVVFSIGAGII